MSAADSALAGLEETLGALLSCLETPGTEDGGVELAWRAVQRAFDVVRGELSGPHPAPSVARIESCLRLHAVAAAELERRRDVLAAQRAACVAARAKLRAQPRERRGGACDVSG